MAAIDEFISRINYLYIEKSKQNIWKKVKKSIIFKDMGNPEIFMLSLVLGLKHGKRKKISNSSNLFRINDLRENVWIALAIGYDELKEIKVFETKDGARNAFKVCEEYANAGIDILNDLMKKPSEFIINLIDELISK